MESQFPSCAVAACGIWRHSFQVSRLYRLPRANFLPCNTFGTQFASPMSRNGLAICLEQQLPSLHPVHRTAAIPIENENFVGKVLLLYRPTEGSDSWPLTCLSTCAKSPRVGRAWQPLLPRLERGHPYYDHFRSRKRSWELRLQGKFKKARGTSRALARLDCWFLWTGFSCRLPGADSTLELFCVTSTMPLPQSTCASRDTCI